MTPEEVGEYVESLEGVKRKGGADQPAWYVRNRLVARMVDATTVVIRVPLEEREALLADHPAGFGVPPRFEAHHKVEAYLDEVDPAGVRAAIDLAWAMQRVQD